MGPMEAVKNVLTKKYAIFSGRAPRSEYWWFSLFSFVVALIITIPCLAASGYFTMAAAMASGDPEIMQVGIAQFSWGWMLVPGIWNLAIILPSLAVTVRRLHDRNLSGWWILGFIIAVSIVSAIPVIGIIFYLIAVIGGVVILALPGDVGGNRFGANPLDPNHSSAVFS